MWAGYTRVSRVGDRAERLISPDLQTERIMGYAAGRFEVEMQEPELDQSGGKVERPILQRIIGGIEAKRYEGIIVAQLDRLSRMDIADALHTIRRIESAGGQVIAVAENFDASTPEGKMARNVILAMGEMQLDRYKRQFRDAKRSAVERGVWPMSRVPFGYRKEGGRLVPSEDAPLVRRAFESRAAGMSWDKVADVLESGTSQAMRVVHNRVYLGETNLGEWRNPRTHEPLVTRDLWEAALASYNPRPSRRGKEALLTGLIRCAECGFVMSPENGRDSRYRCFPRKRRKRCKRPAGISMVNVNGLVEKAFLARVAELRGRASKRTDDLERATTRLSAAEAELDAFQTLTQVTADPNAFSAGLSSRRRAVEEARRELALARLQRDFLPYVGFDWEELTVVERRHVLGSSLHGIFVTKGFGLKRVRIIGLDGFDLPVVFGVALD